MINDNKNLGKCIFTVALNISKSWNILKNWELNVNRHIFYKFPNNTIDFYLKKTPI